MTTAPKPRPTAPGLPRAKQLPLIVSGKVAPPAVVPARMINEVLYCERLMYLEWVQGEFTDNVFTVDGRVTHQRADDPGGKLPPVATKSPKSESPRYDADTDQAAAKEDADDARPYQARSVWLTSEELGLTAKADIVEGDATGKVIPIEYKRGRAPDLPEGAYLPERAQLCAQALLLREQGYQCDEGAIYFAKSKRRVAIAITEQLITTTLHAAGTARAVAALARPPDPLRDSPKCHGCSLVGICLPDEVNLLRRLDGEPQVDAPDEEDQLKGPLSPDPWGLVGEADEPAPATPMRRLYAALDDRVPLYVRDPRSQVGLSGERLVVRGGDGTTNVRLMNTSQVVLQGNVQISTQAMRALLERGIPVTYLSGGGWFLGRVSSTDTKNVDLRMAQHAKAADPAFCLGVARRIGVSKIRNSRTLLRRNHAQLPEVVSSQFKQFMRKAAEAESIETLLGFEGSAARVYFQAFTGMLKRADLSAFDFERRNRRPPRDPVNALLSFVYAMLTKELAITVASVGLDPLLGFYHQPRFGRPALALDLMEEFRPIIADSVVIAAINTNVVDADDFVQVAEACNLKPPARRKIIEAYERRMDQLVIHPVFGYRVSYRRVLELQARLLSRVLLGELEELPAFGTR
jgi:CRISPR-associated protein Cas1